MIKGRRGRCFLLSMWALLGALLVGLAPRSLALAAEPPQAGVQPVPQAAPAPAPAPAAPALAAAKAPTALEEEPPPAGAQGPAPASPQGAQPTPPGTRPGPVEDPEPPPAPLLSDPPQPGETAASYVQRSVQYFGSKEYENAALALEKAYKIDPKPLFLFNIGPARTVPILSRACGEAADRHPPSLAGARRRPTPRHGITRGSPERV